MIKIIIRIIFSQIIIYKTNIVILITIIFSCSLISFLIFLLRINFWLLIIIILIYIRGVIVLFIFIISLTPNEKNSTKKWTKITIFITVIVLNLLAIKTMEKIEFKINSSYKNRLTIIIIIVIIILISAYVPPKIMLMLFKGIKSSK